MRPAISATAMPWPDQRRTASWSTGLPAPAARSGMPTCRNRSRMYCADQPVWAAIVWRSSARRSTAAAASWPPGGVGWSPPGGPVLQQGPAALVVVEDGGVAVDEAVVRAADVELDPDVGQSRPRPGHFDRPVVIDAPGVLGDIGAG
jgi:hypothetical protein